MIVNANGHWILYSKDGKKVLGMHKSKAEAEAQERAIEMSKHKASK